MATVTPGRSTNGRPRTTERSPAFYLVDELAAKRGMSIATLSEVAGIDRNTLYKLSDPRMSTARKIADALGMKTGRLAELLAAVEGDA
jgi:lambda repressor-like predicted transcriptional regulator